MEQQQSPQPEFSQEMRNSLSEKSFDLHKAYTFWYEKKIPVELIPKQFQREVHLPGGKRQIIDSRIPGYTYHHDKGAMVPCPEVWSDDMNP